MLALRLTARPIVRILTIAALGPPSLDECRCVPAQLPKRHGKRRSERDEREPDEAPPSSFGDRETGAAGVGRRGRSGELVEDGLVLHRCWTRAKSGRVSRCMLTAVDEQMRAFHAQSEAESWSELWQRSRNAGELGSGTREATVGARATTTARIPTDCVPVRLHRITLTLRASESGELCERIEQDEEAESSRGGRLGASKETQRSSVWSCESTRALRRRRER